MIILNVSSADPKDASFGNTDEDVEVRAADWLARLDGHNVSEETYSALEAWCRTEPRNLSIFLRLLATWNRLNALKE